jgi:hypothetical protein
MSFELFLQPSPLSAHSLLVYNGFSAVLLPFCFLIFLCFLFRFYFFVFSRFIPFLFFILFHFGFVFLIYTYVMKIWFKIVYDLQKKSLYYGCSCSNKINVLSKLFK